VPCLVSCRAHLPSAFWQKRMASILFCSVAESLIEASTAGSLVWLALPPRAGAFDDDDDDHADVDDSKDPMPMGRPIGETNSSAVSHRTRTRHTAHARARSHTHTIRHTRPEGGEVRVEERSKSKALAMVRMPRLLCASSPTYESFWPIPIITPATHARHTHGTWNDMHGTAT
jgi:hypothetical protein